MLYFIAANVAILWFLLYPVSLILLWYRWHLLNADRTTPKPPYEIPS